MLLKVSTVYVCLTVPFEAAAAENSNVTNLSVAGDALTLNQR